MVSGIPCLSFPALEVGIELVIIPSLVVIAFCVIIQGVWEHRAGRAAGWTLWSCRDGAPGCILLIPLGLGRADPPDGSAQPPPDRAASAPPSPLCNAHLGVPALQPEQQRRFTKILRASK